MFCKIVFHIAAGCEPLGQLPQDHLREALPRLFQFSQPIIGRLGQGNVDAHSAMHITRSRLRSQALLFSVWTEIKPIQRPALCPGVSDHGTTHRPLAQRRSLSPPPGSNQLLNPPCQLRVRRRLYCLLHAGEDNRAPPESNRQPGTQMAGSSQRRRSLVLKTTWRMTRLRD